MHSIALVHSDFGSALAWLADRTLSALLNEELSEELPELPLLRKLVRKRLRREAMVETESNDRSAEARELRLLIFTLMDWCLVLKEEGEFWDGAARRVRKGRPKSAPVRTTNALAALLPGFKLAAPPGKPGRRVKFPVDSEELLRQVEELKKSRSGGKQTSQRDALRRIVEEHLRTKGQHTAGNKTMALVQNLERRIAAFKKLRKSDEE